MKAPRRRRTVADACRRPPPLPGFSSPPAGGLRSVLGASLGLSAHPPPHPTTASRPRSRFADDQREQGEHARSSNWLTATPAKHDAAALPPPPPSTGRRLGGPAGKNDDSRARRRRCRRRRLVLRTPPQRHDRRRAPFVAPFLVGGGTSTTSNGGRQRGAGTRPPAK